MTRHVLMAALASVVLAAGAPAQKKNEPAAANDSVFSSDSRLVLVDSIVTDRKGAYIGDLTSRDFKVREDGKQQTITSFSYQADGAPDGQKQYLVLLFDNSTVPRIDRHYAQDAATKFIESNAGTNRLMSVVEFGATLRVTQNLTDDVDKLKLAVKGAGSSVVSAVAPAVATMGFGNVRSGNGADGALPSALGNLAQGLARVPGRKTIILFSEGLSVSPDQMDGIINECNRANVAIYPVDVRALATHGTGGTSIGDASSSRQQGMYLALQQMATASARQSAADLSAPPSASDVLYGLAKGTGGFLVSSLGKLPDDLNRIGKEQSQYYVLGYLPAKESRPGACHTIRVEVDRGGANVRARTGYCDEKTPEVQAGTPTERDLETRLNAHATPNVPATMQTPFFYVAKNTARVDLALDIPGAAVRFVKDKGRFAATLNVIGIAYLPDGGEAARFNDTGRITLEDQKQVDEFASRPYHFEKQFEMAAGKLDLKVAFSSGTASFGSVETQLTIDSWEPSKFLLSGLALSQTTRPASAAGLGPQVDLFGDKVPLAFKGVQLIPAGTNRLQKSQKAFIYGEIYEPALAVPDWKDDPGVGVLLTVLNGKTGEIVKHTGFMGLKPETVPGTSAVPFGMILPAGDLAPGLYTAEIAAQDAAGNRSLRRIAFELEP